VKEDVLIERQAMDLRRKVAAASLAALLAVSFSLPGGAVAQEKPAAAAGAGLTEGWLYLGRRSGERWQPASPSISSPGYPVKAGATLVVQRDALVYSAVDCKVTPAAEFKPDEAARAALLLKAGPGPLEVLGDALECPSIGKAKTVWASVRIPADRLLTIQK
jgi:hypothetical protein